MESLFGQLDAWHLIFLILALGLALAFEFVNGFHDTANAVATVIYTHSLKPWVAVVWSGCWNLIGVLWSSGAVAFGVIALLPVELVMNVGSAAGFAMVFALLISAIVWNLGTWWLGLPASSSHTLIGSIMGVGLMNAMMTSGSAASGVNWGKAREIGMSLLVSPLVGFLCAALLLILLKMLVKRPELYAAPDPKKAPPLWIRSILCITCTGVSFAHGSNDGQKGMGLVMLILIGIVPSIYALNLATDTPSIDQWIAQAKIASALMDKNAGGKVLAEKEATATLNAFLKNDGTFTDQVFPALVEKNREISTLLDGHKSLKDLPDGQRTALRTASYFTAESIGKLSKTKHMPDAETGKTLDAYKGHIEKVTKFIPFWVKFAVALALGLGTMIGWKRIVVTVGEKIGKSHLTYAQGASAELVAMVTIGLADTYGLPVSTTHVLSSGVAGTMAANRSGLQGKTLRNLLLAWVLTLPVCIFLGASFFAAGLLFVARVLGLH